MTADIGGFRKRGFAARRRGEIENGFAKGPLETSNGGVSLDNEERLPRFVLMGRTRLTGCVGNAISCLHWSDCHATTRLSRVERYGNARPVVITQMSDARGSLSDDGSSDLKGGV